MASGSDDKAREIVKEQNTSHLQRAKELTAVRAKDILARNIIAARTLKGWTQHDLAKNTGFTQPYISRVEKAQASPSIEAIAIIADALKVPMSSLLTVMVSGNIYDTK